MLAIKFPEPLNTDLYFWSGQGPNISFGLGKGFETEAFVVINLGLTLTSVNNVR